MVIWPHSCGQSAQSFYSFLNQVGGCQHPPMGLPGLSKVTVIGVITLWSSSWGLVSVVGCEGPSGSPFFTSFRHGSTPSTGGTLPRRTRCPGLAPAPTLASMVEGQAASSAGTPHCTALIFLPKVLYPMSWTVGTFALASGPGVPCWQPQQIACSISFCPNSALCRNIF